MLLFSVLALGRGSREHQLHSAAFEKGQGGRGIEQVLQSKRVSIELRGFLDVAHWNRDLLDAFEGESCILRHFTPLERSLAVLTMPAPVARRKSQVCLSRAAPRPSSWTCSWGST